MPFSACFTTDSNRIPKDIILKLVLDMIHDVVTVKGIAFGISQNNCYWLI